MKLFDELRVAVAGGRATGAWERGVRLYELELIDVVEERAEIEGHAPENSAELEEWMLDGAADWTQYSKDGFCALICDGDIAKRLFWAWELEEMRNGQNPPNSRETWLDLQTRALCQAAASLRMSYRSLLARQNGGKDGTL